MNARSLLVVALALATTACPAGPNKHESRADARRARDGGVDAGLTLVDPGSGAPVLLMGDRLPDSFPKSVPLYPGAKLLGVAVTTDAGKRTHVVTLATPDAPPLVDDFYRTHAHGFILAGEHAGDDSRDRSLDATDSSVPLHVTISATKSGLATTLQVTTVEG